MDDKHELVVIFKVCIFNLHVVIGRILNKIPKKEYTTSFSNRSASLSGNDANHVYSGQERQKLVEFIIIG